MAIFKGSGVAMATPFTQEGVNYAELERLIEHIIAGKTDALFILGTTGEPTTMTQSEKREVISFCIAKARGRIPVVVGTGTNSTATTVENSLLARELKADGLLVVTPYYNKCTQNGLVEHYRRVAASTGMPIVAYNVPGRTGLNIAPATAEKLADIKEVCAIKEASGNIEQISEVIRLTRGRLDVYSGDDALIVPAMSLGALGVISVAGNVIPDRISSLARLCLKGQFEKARDIQFELAPFIKALFCEVNPIPVKKALSFIGINAGAPRLPLTEMEQENASLLYKRMEELDLVQGI